MYKEFLKKEYPEAFKNLNPDSPLIFFEDRVELSKKVFSQMKSVVKEIYRFKKTFKKQENNFPKTAFKKTNQDSLLMSYDFHVREDKAYLIEINTNASGFLLVNSFYQFKNKPYKEALEALFLSFLSEWKKSGRSEDLKNITLIDENPREQKMILEFFMFKDFFKKRDINLEIADPKDITLKDSHLYLSSKKLDFIYNRTTDFYFEKYSHLEKSYLEGTCVFSPHPREYYLLADKMRLCDFYKEESLKKIRNNLLETNLVREEDKDFLWKERKKYFFKPVKSYGGKRVYNGSSISRKKFEELFKEDFLYQKTIKPSLTVDSKKEEWKTDFRIYVYEDQVQQVCARCYQGQISNFQVIGSGFALVEII